MDHTGAWKTNFHFWSDTGCCVWWLSDINTRQLTPNDCGLVQPNLMLQDLSITAIYSNSIPATADQRLITHPQYINQCNGFIVILLLLWYIIRITRCTNIWFGFWAVGFGWGVFYFKVIGMISFSIYFEVVGWKQHPKFDRWPAHRIHWWAGTVTRASSGCLEMSTFCIIIKIEENIYDAAVRATKKPPSDYFTSTQLHFSKSRDFFF